MIYTGRIAQGSGEFDFSGERNPWNLIRVMPA